MTTRIRSVTSAALVIGAASGAAQNPRVIELKQPDVIVDEQFSLLRGARELPDGRLLVTDWIEQRVAIIDFARKSVTGRNRVGSGPAEFRLPSALFPFRGDSTLLVDVGNSRFAVLNRDGIITRIFNAPAPAAGSPSAVDASGRLYYSIPPWHATRPLKGDTVEVAVQDAEGGSARTIAAIHGSTMAPQNGPTDGPRVPIVVFARQDAIAVTPGGRVAIVHGDNYSVEWFENGRSVARGPAYGTRPVPASSADRIAWVRQFVQSSPMSGKGEGGSMGHTPASFASADAVAGMIRRSTFAETLPFFRAGDVRIDAAGRIWAGRWNRSDEARAYDVFDTQGRRVSTIQLRAGRALIALGRAHAYVAFTDGLGLQTIERYPLPALPFAS